MKNSKFIGLVILLIINAIVMSQVFFAVRELNIRAASASEEVQNQFEKQTRSALDQFKKLVLSPNEDSEKLRERLGEIVGDYLSEEILNQKVPLSRAVVDAVWTSVLPENLFEMLRMVLEVNFTVLAKQVSNIADALAGAFAASNDLERAAPYARIVSGVAAIVAKIQPLGDNPYVPIDESDLTLIGNLIESLPNVALDSAGDVDVWRQTSLDLVILSQRVSNMNWVGRYIDSYGYLRSWNYNSYILPVAQVVNEIALTILEASYNVENPKSTAEERRSLAVQFLKAHNVEIEPSMSK